MAALTITFDENKHQLLLQKKLSERTHKQPINCRSIKPLGDSLNSGSTSTPRTIVFGTLGSFPLLEEETAPAKKQKTASQRVTTMTPKADSKVQKTASQRVTTVTPKAGTKKPEARGTPSKPQPKTNQPMAPKWITKELKDLQKDHPASCSAVVLEQEIDFFSFFIRMPFELQLFKRDYKGVSYKSSFLTDLVESATSSLLKVRNLEWAPKCHLVRPIIQASPKCHLVCPDLHGERGCGLLIWMDEVATEYAMGRSIGRVQMESREDEMRTTLEEMKQEIKHEIRLLRESVEAHNF